MREGIVALVVRPQSDQEPVLVEALSDSHEICMLEAAVNEGLNNPLEPIYQCREQRKVEDEEFGDYVEDLLSQPFLKPDIQEQAVQWLKSKIKIEEFQKSETEATDVIAEYAYKVYKSNPQRRDFTLSGSSARVRIRVYEITEELGELKAA